jgi:hypothetical protein
MSVCLIHLLVFGRHCHFTHDYLPSADDSVQSNLEISKLLVSSVQHPRQKWKRREKYDCEREREEEENFQLSSVHLWLKLEFLIGLN